MISNETKGTDRQNEAILHKDGPLLVLAGPGAGKTFVITRRVQALIEHWKVDPSGILVITFTNAAADEMRRRFSTLCPGKGEDVRFGTFHSVFFYILRSAYGFSAEQILREGKRREIFRDILATVSYEVQDPTEFFLNMANEIGRAKEFLAFDGRFGPDGKERIPTLKDFRVTGCPDTVFRAFFEQYQARMKEERLIDFDDMCVLCYELLRDRPDILANWQERFRYLLVDEMQDTNRLQYEILLMLTAKHKNLMMVGDDDQSIYRFRGARPDIMLGFKKEFPEGKIVVLDYNFRSVPEIIKASQMLISHNEKRYAKDIKPSRTACDERFNTLNEVNAISVRAFDDQEQEREFLLKEIQKLSAAGVPYREMAVLYRTNVLASPITEILMRADIPFHVRDAYPKLYDHWITRDVFTYVKLANQYRLDRTMRRSMFLQVMNRPKRYIRRDVLSSQDVSFEDLKEKAAAYPYMHTYLRDMERDLSMIGGDRKREAMTPYAAVHYIANMVGYKAYLEEQARERGLETEVYTDVLNELLEAAKHFETFGDWNDHIEELRQAAETENKRREEQKQESVSLMTFHGAKGLEFQAVFVIDAVEGVTPYVKSETAEELEEERRMFYVAITRAKDRLYLLWPKKRYGKKQKKSRYLEETVLLSERLAPGQKIHHRAYGDGTVVSVDGDKLRIAFAAPKKELSLSIKFCMENELLQFP